MAAFRFTNKAVKDLSNIWNYTVETWSEKQADTYYRRLINACAQIANKPALGKVYDDVYPGLRVRKVSKHIICYRIMEDEFIEITRILHEKMDWKNKINR